MCGLPKTGKTELLLTLSCPIALVTAYLCSEGNVLEGNDVSGVVCVSRPWPSIARTVYGDHDRCVL